MITRSLKLAFFSTAGPLMKLNGWIYRTLRAPTSGEVKVHLGPGQMKYLQGWYNVDANPITAKIDVWADLRNPLPFKNNTVDCFYSHHVIEHLEDMVVIRHFAEMFRCLKPGGVIRVGGPDSEHAAIKLAEGDINWFGDYPDKYDSIGGKFHNFVSCRSEHLTILSFGFLKEIAEKAGFVNVQRCQPVTGTFHAPLFDDAMKQEYEYRPEFPMTVLIEAEKPK